MAGQACNTDCMAKRSKQALSELDAAIDQLGGGAPPIKRPRRALKVRQVAKKTRKRKTQAIKK